MEQLSKGERELLERIRNNNSPIATYLRLHLHQRNGHYVGDECWTKMVGFINEILSRAISMKEE